MRYTLAALALFVLVGCGGDSTGPSTNPVGTWHLQSVNGALPFSVVSDGTLITITGSTLTISSTGSFTDAVSYTVQQGTTQLSGTSTEAGNWLSSNGAMSFYDSSDGTTYQGSVSGRTLTEIDGSLIRVYGR